MRLQLLYFAALRERVGCAAESVTVPESVACVDDLRAWLAARGGNWSEALGGSRPWQVAVDQSLAEPGTPLHDGAEVAFFPPVTGG
jgi:molybdopterin synthase sulfur carrier subunit